MELKERNEDLDHEKNMILHVRRDSSYLLTIEYNNNYMHFYSNTKRGKIIFRIIVMKFGLGVP